MFTSKLVLPGLLLLGAALAAPAPDKAVADETSISTTATVAPATTTLGETSSVVPDLQTASTDAAKPAPTNEITACHNLDGEFRPFCMPKNNQIYWVWSTHHVTWDTSFFPTANTTLKIHGVYNTNETTIPDAAPHHGEDEAFSSEEIDAGWGYYQWRLDKHLLTNRRVGSANITVRIVALPSNGQPAQWLTGPTINLQWKPKDPPKPRPVNNDAQALYIALPLVFGFATLMIVGTFFWNRRLRHIGMPSVMGRPRRLNRKKGPGASRKDRAGNTNKEQGIRLMEHGGDGSDGEDWTEGWSHEVPGRDSEEPGTRVFESKVGKKRM